MSKWYFMGSLNALFVISRKIWPGGKFLQFPHCDQESRVSLQTSLLHSLPLDKWSKDWLMSWTKQKTRTFFGRIRRKREDFFLVEVGILKPKHSASTAFTTLALANQHSVEIWQSFWWVRFYVKSDLACQKPAILPNSEAIF